MIAKRWKLLERLDIRVIETPISRLEGESDKLEGIRFTDGNFLPRSALFFSPGQYQRSPLAEQLGCEFCEESIVFSVAKMPRRTSRAFMPREMPVVACSSSSRLRPKVCRQPLRSIARSSTRMLRVTRCAITSPANPRLRVVLRQATRPLTKCSCERLARVCATSQQKAGLGYREPTDSQKCRFV